MKIRIKGNTVRLRLTKSEVDYFRMTGLIEERTEFGNNSFAYALQSTQTPELKAEFSDGAIRVLMPEKMADEWTATNAVGFNSEMDIGNKKKLYILVEKDFKCLDETVEDQSDNYENPLAANRNDQS